MKGLQGHFSSYKISIKECTFLPRSPKSSWSCSFLPFCVYMCVYSVCMFVYVYIQCMHDCICVVCVPVHAWVQKPDVMSGALCCSSPYILRQSGSLAEPGASWLAPSNFTPLPSTGATNVCGHVAFYTVVRIWTQVVMLVWQERYWLAHDPSPKYCQVGLRAVASLFSLLVLGIKIRVRAC